MNSRDFKEINYQWGRGQGSAGESTFWYHSQSDLSPLNPHWGKGESDTHKLSSDFHTSVTHVSPQTQNK